MLVAHRTITLSLALLVLLGLTSPHPTLAAIKRVGSGRRLQQKKASAAAADGHRRNLQEEEVVTYIEPNGEEITADQYGYGGYGKGKHLYTIGGKGSSCGGPYQMCCSDPAARCVPGYGCDYKPTILDPEESDLDKGLEVPFPPYTCMPCGGNDQPCCKTSCSTEDCESECTKGNTCNLFSNKCETCGTSAGEPCCEGNLCPGAGLSCDTSTMMCMDCGDVDEICCQGDICNYNATGDVFCNTDVTPKKCEFCGDLGQLCCPGDVCSSSDHVCNTVTGRCEDCGSLDQACCAGEKCPGAVEDDVLFCNADANQCEACGGAGDQCCPGDLCSGSDVACNTVTGLCEECGTGVGAICCSGNKCPFGDDGDDETDDRLSCNTATFPPTCERCGEFGGPCCPTEDFSLPCDLGGAFSCNANGRCPDVGGEGGDPPTNEKCQLGNGKADARDLAATGGCAVWIEDVLTPFDCLCCKGKCNKGPVTDRGNTFYYCSAGSPEDDCSDLPDVFPPAPAVTLPDAGGEACAHECTNPDHCPDPDVCTEASCNAANCKK